MNNKRVERSGIAQLELSNLLLPHVPVELVRAALDNAAGNELGSGKLASPESSSALAVNGFGFFLERPELLPRFPGLEDLDWPPIKVDIERQMRFPWSGGRHPWLDAAVETTSNLIGVESKRFEPFRDRKKAKLSDAYWRDVWGDGMDEWCAMRDRLRSDPAAYVHLDAAQLVKHAFGLSTQAKKLQKKGILLYLYAEPSSGRIISDESFSRHREEISEFTDAVSGADLYFASCSWKEWLSVSEGKARDHAQRVLKRFSLKA